MTRPVADIELVADLISAGVSQAEAARRTGIPRATLRDWIKVGLDEAMAKRRLVRPPQPCDERPCSSREVPSRRAYAYLLGMYLGDGCISAVRGGGFRLRITLDAKYPGIVDECVRAMASVRPNRVGRVDKVTWLELWSCSKHWPCLFPQHGAGPKHRREIVLDPWQEEVALDQYPDLLLRGLVHSDGCRVLNWVNGTAYPRYHFSNRSDQIREIFAKACRRLGVACRPNNRWELSVARRASVARLDEFIGPKT